MPYRVLPLVTDHYYHVLNRGVAQQLIFSSIRDYDRFLLYLSYYRHVNAPVRLSKFLQIPKEDRIKILFGLESSNRLIVDIIAYCCMPNHFHLLLKQNVDGGISLFVKKVADGYSRYFNTKLKRIGPVFQGTFKAVHVTSEEQLIHLSRYIHLNPLVSGLVREQDCMAYPWSSLRNYLKPEDSSFVNHKPVTELFGSAQKYKNFVIDRVGYGKKLEEIKHQLLE